MDSAHHVPNRAILARRVHALQDQQNAMFVVRVKFALKFEQFFLKLVHMGLGLNLIRAKGVIRGVMLFQAPFGLARDLVLIQ
jgi:hypothetical protein